MCVEVATVRGELYSGGLNHYYQFDNNGYKETNSPRTQDLVYRKRHLLGKDTNIDDIGQ